MSITDKNQQHFITVNQLMGMNQRQNPDDIPDNYSPLLVNISTDKPGVWASTNGRYPLHTLRTSGGIKSLIEWSAFTIGTESINPYRKIHIWRSLVVNSNSPVEEFDQNTQTSKTIDATHATNDFVETVNFKGSVYVIGLNTNMYTENGASTYGLTQYSVNPQSVRAKCMAVSQNTLFIANITALGGVVVLNGERRVYYTAFSGNTTTDMFYNVARGENTNNSTNYFELFAPIVGLFRFSITGILYIFTRDECYSFDVRLLENRIGPLQKFNIGLMNKRSICEVNGAMTWMDYNGRIWTWTGYGLPENASWELQDDEHGEALLSQLDKNNLDLFCAGSIGNKIYFSLGQSIAYKGTLIINPVLKGLMTQSRQGFMWTVDDFPVKPSIFREALIGSNKKLIFGDLNSDNIYQINNGVSDGPTTPIYALARTKFIDMGIPLYDKNFIRIYIKYRTQPKPGTYLRVRWAVNGNNQYTTVSDPIYQGAGILPTGVITGGTIDMNVGYNTTAPFNTAVIQLPTECSGKSLSIEVSTYKLNENFEVSAFGFEFSVEGYELSSRT